MYRMPRNSGLMPNLLLAALLLFAQFGLSLHDFGHEPGAPQGKVCSTCVTASQLSAASVDTHTQEVIVPATWHHRPEQYDGPTSAALLLVRQRGPPPPL